MSWENLIYIADFLWVNGQRAVSLIGGEPTLHPQCVDFILYLLDRGFYVTLFSNGLLRSTILDEFDRYLMNTLPDHFNIVCNLNDPIQTPQKASEETQLRDYLSLMGPWTTPGFNIYRPDFTLDFLFDLIQVYGMKRHLRLGVAHPIPGRKTSFMQPQDMRHIVERLFTYRQLFETYRIRLGFDCGFTMCSFSDQELGWLRRYSGGENFNCRPAMDISPDMSLYHCFPLSSYRRRSLFEFDSLAEINTHFARMRGEIQSEIAGVFQECDGCRHRQDDVCSGGGLCHAVLRFIDEAPIRIREIENEISAARMSI
jgi:hypothetical protein